MCLACALHTSTQTTNVFHDWNALLTNFFKNSPTDIGGLLDILQHECPHAWDVLDVFTYNKPDNTPKMSVMGWAMLRSLQYPHIVQDLLMHWTEDCSKHIFDVVCWPFVLEYNLNSGVHPLHQGLHLFQVDQITASLILLCTRLSDTHMQEIREIAKISPIVLELFDSINSGRQYNILQDLTQNCGRQTAGLRKM